MADRATEIAQVEPPACCSRSSQRLSRMPRSLSFHAWNPNLLKYADLFPRPFLYEIPKVVSFLPPNEASYMFGIALFVDCGRLKFKPVASNGGTTERSEGDRTGHGAPGRLFRTLSGYCATVITPNNPLA
jgi:hypothetical protein